MYPYVFSFFSRKFKNVEDAIAFLDTILGEDDDAVRYDIALEPPEEGRDSDVDDLDNDAVIVDENVNLIGSRLLALPAHITCTTRSGNLNQIEDISDDETETLSGTQSKKRVRTASNATKKRKKRNLHTLGK